MVPSNYLSKLLYMPDFSEYRKPENGIQWNGQHFFVFLNYALNLSSRTSEHDGFIHRLRRLDCLARDCLSPHPGITCYIIFLQDLYSLNEILASFVHCLVEALDELLVGKRDPKIIVPSEIDALWEKLKFLLAILGDKPFQCAQLEETKNVLGEIEFVANEAGVFLLSFFITRDRVTCEEMDRALSVLLPKFEQVGAKIREHCVTVSGLRTQSTNPSFSVFIVGSVLGDLSHLINHRKEDFIVEVKDQIKSLYEELNYSISFLNRDSMDHESQQNTELTELVKQLIDLAYEVEYLVSWFVAGIVPVWYLTLRIPNIIQKNKPKKTAFQEIELYSGIRCVGVSESPLEHISSTQVAEMNPTAGEIIMGFDEKTTEIVNQLVRGSRHLEIVRLIGMGGIGKTTLAKKLYNHSSVVNHFDRRSWCVVSQTYQKKKLLIEILRCITKISEEEASRMEEGSLAERIHKNLKGNRYFLVIDDIWDKKAWEGMKIYFPNDSNGSRILFTSWNKDVAQGIINELHLLSVDECWDLLQHKVFHGSLCRPELEEVGKKIATNCNGLPPSVVGIAGVLTNMVKNESSWHELASWLSSFIDKDQDILELSYMHLPARLKPCFLYFGILGEDEEIPVRQLLYHWS